MEQHDVHMWVYLNNLNMYDKYDEEPEWYDDYQFPEHNREELEWEAEQWAFENDF